ncbi:MAG: asparagine synthase (glutamine-hydrolyzing) [Pelagibacterales bacterium]|nr:asparagine synthase (glutamine-hydrolyzing) [Pelagibacterales bacterium]
MCGFTGIINFNGLNRTAELDKKMMAALKRLYPRGPDQQDIWTDLKSYFVHSRLSIIDTSLAGRQPMYKYNKVISYNGEIYNFKEIKSKLIKLGYKFSSESDCEVLLAGWDKWGIKVLDFISGMFAFSIWDQKKEKLYLVRDPFGKKPLYYSYKSGLISFSSDLKSLEKVVDCGQINIDAVHSLFSFRFIHDPISIYEKVNKVPAGHFLEVNKDNIILSRWYNLSNKASNVFDKEEVSNDLISIFDKSVNRRLVSDVPIGLLLSGGIDSSLILSSLAEMGKNIPCFTMGFENSSKYYEERPYAKKLANHFGMEHFDIEMNPQNILNIIPEVFESSDEPFADSSSLPFYALSKEVSQKVTVALSGDGGDEVFGGYRKYVGENWTNIGLMIPNILRKILINHLIENKDTSYGEFSRRLKRYLLNTTKDPIERHINWLKQINEKDISSIIGNSRDYKNMFIEARAGFSDKINSILVGDMKISLSGDMLVKLDRMSMANSLEIRSPFLDKELVEYAFTIPGKYKVGKFKGKKILRNVFSKRLPKWSMNLPKKGFEVPLANWFKEDLRSMVEHVSMKKNLDKIGIQNHTLINSWKDDLFFNNKDTSWKLWTLISYFYWCENRGII